MRIEGPKKTIIYLDQFVISHIVKALDPEFPRRPHLNEFWLELFRKLDRLLKLQIIVCPDSIFHLHESLLSSDISFQDHQDVYTHLSNGCTFYDEMYILQQQVHAHFRDYSDEIHRENNPYPLRK